MTRARPSRSLARDQRGAVLIVGVFTAALLVGMLYFVVGVGQTIRHRERLQDAADAAAFATAALHAHGMNAVALLNRTKAALLAAALAGGGAPPQGAIEAADRAQAELRDRVPAWAAEQAEREVLDRFGDPVPAGLAWPLRPLPVEPGEPEALCEEVIEMLPEGAGGDDALARCVALGVKPYRLQRDAALGGEPFQLRLFVGGRPPPATGERGVRVATWRLDEPGGRAAELRDALGALAFAQAEMYDGADEPRADLLWDASWRARMRRFRAPDADLAELAELCAARLADDRSCRALGDLLRDAPDSIVH